MIHGFVMAAVSGLMAFGMHTLVDTGVGSGAMRDDLESAASAMLGGVNEQDPWGVEAREVPIPHYVRRK